MNKLVEYFKNLSKSKRALIGIVFFPITLIILSINSLRKAIINKNISKIILSSFYSLISVAIFASLINTTELYISMSNKSNEEQEQSYESENIDTLDNEVGVLEDVESEEKVDENKNPFGTVMEKPVMNGSKTERIGTYAEVMSGGIEINKDNLIQFYNEVVKDSEYNWVTLNIDGETGLQFAGSTHIFTYGTLDKESCIIEDKGTGFIYDDKIDYE